MRILKSDVMAALVTNNGGFKSSLFYFILIVVNNYCDKYETDSSASR
jgi:hypothetical protein